MNSCLELCGEVCKVVFYALLVVFCVLLNVVVVAAIYLPGLLLLGILGVIFWIYDEQLIRRLLERPYFF